MHKAKVASWPLSVNNALIRHLLLYVIAFRQVRILEADDKIDLVTTTSGEWVFQFDAVVFVCDCWDIFRRCTEPLWLPVDVEELSPYNRQRSTQNQVLLPIPAAKSDSRTSNFT
jgi:hypothetical protein